MNISKRTEASFAPKFLIVLRAEKWRLLDYKLFAAFPGIGVLTFMFSLVVSIALLSAEVDARSVYDSATSYFQEHSASLLAPANSAKDIETTEPTCLLQWSVVPGPSSGTYTYLTGVAAVSANDVWAVGYYHASGYFYDYTFVEHWDGSAWSVIPSPNAGTDTSHLQAISVVSGTDIWAVGYYMVYTTWQTLTMHWNGNQWSIVPSPNNPTYSTDLFGVTAISSNDVWAVGYTFASGSGEPLTMHWNGSQWSIMPSPNLGPVVGEGFGARILKGVSARATNDVWAVGYSSSNVGTHALAMHWNGGQWSVIPSPDIGGGAGLNGVATVSANDAWAVGYYAAPGAIMRTLTLHWNGNAWSVVTSPNAGSATNFLQGVAATSTGEVWAVGCYGDTCDLSSYYRQTLTMHWDGTQWSIIPSPNADRYYNALNAVTAVSYKDVWSVGGVSSAPLIEHVTSVFVDVQPSDYFYRAVSYLYCHGAISGYSNGTFRPYDTTTRGQLSKIAAIAEGWSMYTPQTPTFRDVPASNAFYPYIETAYRRGIISGYNCGTGCLEFRPGNDVSRGQLSKIIVLAEQWTLYTPPMPTFRDVSGTNPFYPYVETAYNRAILSGYSCGTGCLDFQPASNATRGQISKIVYQAVVQP